MPTACKGLLVVILFFSLLSINAQEKVITGTVVDQTAVPLPGVTIIVEGTTRGTQTDFDGNYSIRASVGEALQFSYLGQKTVTITVGASSVINVTLEEDAEALEEVVVQGYRTASREKSSIASQTIASETIQDRPNASVIQTLSGQVAGLEINTVSG